MAVGFEATKPAGHEVSIGQAGLYQSIMELDVHESPLEIGDEHLHEANTSLGVYKAQNGERQVLSAIVRLGDISLLALCYVPGESPKFFLTEMARPGERNVAGFCGILLPDFEPRIGIRKLVDDTGSFAGSALSAAREVALNYKDPGVIAITSLRQIVTPNTIITAQETNKPRAGSVLNEAFIWSARPRELAPISQQRPKQHLMVVTDVFKKDVAAEKNGVIVNNNKPKTIKRPRGRRNAIRR